MSTTFSVNWDYRCPFARNVNEHLIMALRNGADYDVSFKAFSQLQSHVEEGKPALWDNPSKRNELLSMAAGIVCRERFPEQFYDAHLSLFAMRHEDGEDLRDPTVVRSALRRADVDADAVFNELEDRWAFEMMREEHEGSVERHQVFGVPTFIAGDDAVFIRLMHRPQGDADVALATMRRVVDLLVAHPELNEYKHTTVPF